MKDCNAVAAHRFHFEVHLIPQKAHSHDADPYPQKYLTLCDLINIISPPPQPPWLMFHPFDLARLNRHDPVSPANRQAVPLPSDRRLQC
jgi:hypothetical protein